jgi:hypothetical protein
MVDKMFVAEECSNRLAVALKIAGSLALPVGATALLYLLQDRLVFNPARTPPTTGSLALSHKKRAVTLHMRDGTRLRGWWHRPSNSSGPAPGVIYFGGRNEEVSWVTAVSSCLGGAHLLAVNYRGTVPPKDVLRRQHCCPIRWTCTTGWPHNQG